MFKKLVLVNIAALAFAAAGTASAHTISLGTYNAGAPGSVTLAMGTYDHGSGFPQGSMTLTAGPGIPPTIPANFTSFTNTKPIALVDGVNNFYADAHGSTAWGTLPSNSYTSATNLVDLGDVVDWQEVTFTGLVAGLYTYQLAGMTSANWTNVNSFENNWSGTILITESVVNPTPEPGSLALAGLALAGLAAVRRRRAA